MRTFFATACLIGASGLALRADFNFESKTRLTAGVVSEATLHGEPLVRGRKAVSATHMIKTNRLVTLTKSHATVVDLNSEKITEIDLAKKTYRTLTFAQMKEILDAAKSKQTAAAAFDVSSKAAGGGRTFGFFNGRQNIATMDRITQNPASVAHVLVDSWLLTMPGFSEAEGFRRKLGEKLSYAYATGLWEIGISNPELLAGFEEAGKIDHDGDDMPVELTIRMGSADSGDLTPPDAVPQKSGVVSETLGRIGNLGRKKNTSEPAPPPPGLLLELTTELSNFGSGPADEIKFMVPEGFNQVQPSAKTGR